LKRALADLFAQALARLPTDLVPDSARPAAIVIDRTRDKTHGDFACNLAMVMAKAAGRKPRELAEALVAALPASPLVVKVEIAGPGFINLFLAPDAKQQTVRAVLAEGAAYGRSTMGGGRKVLIEFVSANPTGPMHVGHGRNAAHGDTVANLMDFAGFKVTREYYINDAGRQTDILAVSLWVRYLELCGEAIPLPANAYPGDYIIRSAERLKAAHGAAFHRTAAEVLTDLPPDEPAGGDKDTYIDAFAARARALLGTGYDTLKRAGLADQLADIRATLDAFGVRFDRWQSERELVEANMVQHAVDELAKHGAVYESEGALWLATSKLGDEKDRVLRRADGTWTYFAADVAYHVAKVEQGYDLLIDVWGADHHGYIARVRAAIEALAGRGKDFEVALIQFVTLASGRMGKRSGNFVTLKDLIDEAGRDATRFFYLNRSNDQHLEFDIELARSQSNDNPVYYVQYAHARICSVFRQAAERGVVHDAARGLANLGRLTESHETDLIEQLARFPELIELAARDRAPQVLAHQARELAMAFHTYYNSHQFLVEDEALRDARLCLVTATQVVLRSSLTLLGVAAPESM
jgi:arginyl-tRNA synthetase